RRAPVAAVCRGAWQDCSAPPDWRLYASSAPPHRGHQAGAQHRPAAIRSTIISFIGDLKMEVILKEDVPKLGHRGEVVKVAEGYGRNYLLPRKLAIEATQGNKVVIEQMKQSAVRRSAVEKSDAEALARQLE